MLSGEVVFKTVIILYLLLSNNRLLEVAQAMMIERRGLILSNGLLVVVCEIFDMLIYISLLHLISWVCLYLFSDVFIIFSFVLIKVVKILINLSRMTF